VIDDARQLRSEIAPQWQKNRGFWRSVPAAYKGIVFWNTLERNKVGRVLPLHALALGFYLCVGGWWRESFLLVELGVLLFAMLTWYSIEIINSVFEYLLDELHGSHFDERFGHIKDMGGAASLTQSVGLTVLTGIFSV